MPRKSRKKSKSSSENDASKGESTEKICQQRDDQVPSSSSNIQKPGLTKRQTRGSSAQSVSQHASNKNANTDNKLLALLKKPGIHEILSGFRENASSTSPLADFKIPKKKLQSSTGNEDTGPTVLGVGKASSSHGKFAKQPLPKTKGEDEKKACKRKSEAIDDTDQMTQSPKRRSGSVEVSKGKAHAQETVQSQTTNRIFCETSTLRTTIKAKRTLPSSLPSDPSPVPPELPAPASTTVVDTPQMKQLKAQIVSTTAVDTPQMKQLKAQIASRKTKEVQKQRKRQSAPPPVVHTPQIKSTPSRSANSIEESYPRRLSEIVKDRSSESHATHAYNPISEILQIVRNDGTDANVQFDTTDAMDVDVIQTASATVKKLLIIVDTNVWLGHQLLIRELLDIRFQTLTGPIKATVIIPWMVLQEIDHRIHKKSGKVSEFRGAAKFIHGLLSNHHPQVKGEKATDAVIGNDFNELMADDSILNCAIKCTKLTQVKTVLLTNDINLLNKALVHGLAAFKASNELISNLRRCLSDNSDSYSHVICDLQESGYTSANQSQTVLPSNSFIASPFHAVNSSFTSNSSAQVQECSWLEDIEMDVDDPMGMDESEFHHSELITSKNDEISTSPVVNQVSSSPPASDPPTFEAVATAVQQSLTSIIVPQMVKEYGQDGWKFAIKVKPPFTVDSAVKCIQAHWIAVFSYIFSSRSKTVVDELVNTFHQKPGSLNSNEFKIWRLKIAQLALALLSHNGSISNTPRVAECCRLLQTYIQVESNNST